MKRILAASAVWLLAASCAWAGASPAPSLPSPARYALDRDVYLKFERNAAKAAASNPIDLPASAGLATITTPGSATAGLTKVYAIATTPSLFTFYNGVPTTAATFYKKMASVTVVSGGTVNTTQMQYGARMAVDSDCTGLDLYMAGSSTLFRVLINGQYVSKTGSAYGSNSGTTIINLAFGSQTRRRIDIEWEQNGGPQASSPTMKVAPTCSVWPVDASDRLRIAYYGDSFGSGTGGTLQNDALEYQAAKLFGGIDADPWPVAIGGTGYVISGGQYTFIQHINDLDAASFDMLIVAGGINDAGQAGIQAAAQTFLTAARAKMGNKPIIVLGPWPGNSGPSANVLSAEASISAAVTALNDPGTFFVPVAAASPDAWEFGTGTTASPASNGNSDIYTGPNPPHPNDAGHAFLGRRVNVAVRSVMQTWGVRSLGQQ